MGCWHCHCVLVGLGLVRDVCHDAVRLKYTPQLLNFFLCNLPWHHRQDLSAHVFYLTVSNSVRGQIVPWAFLTWIVLASVKEWQCWPPPLARGDPGCLSHLSVGTLLLFKAMLQISHASCSQPIYRTVLGLDGPLSTERGLLSMSGCVELLAHIMAHGPA